jgi:hypothetical protein
MKALRPLSIVVTLAAAPVFAECVAPLNSVRIPNGNTATMDEILAANHAIQEITTEVEAYTHCLKAEQEAKIAAIGPDITDDQKSRMASQYVNRQKAENEKLQTLADLYSVAVRNFRAKQAAVNSTEQSNQEAAITSAAAQDAAEKSRHGTTAQKRDQGAVAPVVPKGN